MTYWNRAAERTYGWLAVEALGRDIVGLVTPNPGQAEAEEIMAALSRGEVWAGEFSVRRKNGETFVAMVTNAPILDRNGDVVGVVGVSSDLTAQKELQAQLRQAQKMEAIGRLAGGVAHDFNNLLTAIQGNLELALAATAQDSGVADDLLEIRSSADRAASLTRQLLAFSRKQLLQARVLDLRKEIADM